MTNSASDNTTAVWWIKRDMRVHDNRAFSQAADADYVLPLYILEPRVWHGPDFSDFHRAAVSESLADLHQQIGSNGGVCIQSGPAVSVFQQLNAKVDIDAVYSYQETGLNHTFERDQALQDWFDSEGIRWRQFQHKGVIRGLDDRGKRRRLFQEYLKAGIEPVPENVQYQPEFQYELPERIREYAQDDMLQQTMTRQRAVRTLQKFLKEGAINYPQNISSMNTAPQFASRLSVYLAWGLLSLREVMLATKQRKQDLQTGEHPQKQAWINALDTFESRLYWHAHFIQKLEDEPKMEFTPQNAAFKKVRWENDPEKIKAWKTGETGVPMVDAAIRCFRKTGYLNFRSRAMIASFGIHALHISWQRILYPYAKMMADYVPGIHVPQLQMQAGVTGINTIRNYNPNKQMQDHDPQARFIKEWCPKLKPYSAEEIYRHGTGEKTLAEYPNPIVDEKKQRKDMLDQLYTIKNSDTAKRLADEVYEKHGSRRK